MGIEERIDALEFRDTIALRDKSWVFVHINGMPAQQRRFCGGADWARLPVARFYAHEYDEVVLVVPWQNILTMEVIPQPDKNRFPSDQIVQQFRKRKKGGNAVE